MAWSAGNGDGTRELVRTTFGVLRHQRCTRRSPNAHAGHDPAKDMCATRVINKKAACPNDQVEHAADTKRHDQGGCANDRGQSITC